ncbi:hypothetical protein K8I61_05755 [bacterium]|nr:hypothetical protein [bacterium]
MSLTIAALVAMNAYVVVDEELNVRGFPHLYHVTALQKYFGLTETQLRATDNDFAVDTMGNNWRFSPLYAASTLAMRIGGTSIEAIRLSGQVFLVGIFVCALAIGRKRFAFSDRLIVATAVAVTPSVLSMSREIEDHNLHVLVLVLAAMNLDDRDNRRSRDLPLPFYFLPAIDVLVTHMFTNAVVAMISFAAMYAAFIVPAVRSSPKKVLAHESWRVALSAVALAAALVVRFGAQSLYITLMYYGEETNQAVAAHLPRHPLAYPQALFFGAVGLGLTLAAVPALWKRYRFEGFWVYGAWALAPLAVLSLMAKKHNNYVWYAAPAVAIIAARVSWHLPRRIKIAIPALLLLSAAGRHLCDITPAEDWIDRQVYYHGVYADLTARLYIEPDIVAAYAREIEQLDQSCDRPGRAILLFGNASENFVLVLNFVMLRDDPTRETFGISPEVRRYPRSLAAVELLHPVLSDVPARSYFHSDDQDRVRRVLRKSHVPADLGADLRLWCPKSPGIAAALP